MTDRLAGIVLAAGRGTRMKSDLPKVLHPLLGRPLLSYPLDLLAELGATPRVVVIGTGADRVRAAFDARGLRFALQDPPRGTGDAVQVGLAALAPEEADTVLILNGDLPLLTAESIRALIEYHHREDADLTFLSVELPDPTGYGRVVRDAAGAVDAIVEEADADAATRSIREVNGGLYVARLSALRPALDDWAARPPDNSQNEIYFPPVAGVIRERSNGTGKVAAFRLPADRHGELGQVNDRVELAQVTAVKRLQVIERFQRDGVTVIDPGTTYIEEDVEIGHDTVIWPNTVILAGARIGVGCQVGPFAQLRTGAVLRDRAEVGNFTEVKNTELGEGSKAKHLSYLGDGRIGRGVNIGAGTIFANYDGKKKSPTVVGDGAFIGSGTILVAPVEVGEGATTGAGSVVVRGRDVPAGSTVVGVPAKPIGDRSSGPGEGSRAES